MSLHKVAMFQNCNSGGNTRSSCRSVTSFVVGCCVPTAGVVMALHILQCMFTVRQHTSSDQCKHVIVERKHAVRVNDVKCFELMHKSGRTGM